MRPYPGIHTHWPITRNYPPPKGATSSRPYPGQGGRAHTQMRPHPRALTYWLITRKNSSPSPHGSYILSYEERGEEGGETKSIPGKELLL